MVHPQEKTHFPKKTSDTAYLAAVERTDLTDREILAMALEGAVQSEQEYAVVVEKEMGVLFTIRLRINCKKEDVLPSARSRSGL